MMLFFTVFCSTIAVPALFLWRLYFIRMGELVPGTNGLLTQFASDHSPVRNYDRFPSTLAAVAPPRRFHSHNDYEHQVPLYEALSYGAGSVEADVWLVGDELLVCDIRSTDRWTRSLTERRRSDTRKTSSIRPRR